MAMIDLRLRGFCSVCGKEISVRRSRTAWVHGKERRMGKPCNGSGKKVKKYVKLGKSLLTD